MGMNDSLSKSFARAEEALPTITYPALLNRPTMNNDMKNKMLYFFYLRSSFCTNLKKISKLPK
jgi:hypothetical protein